MKKQETEAITEMQQLAETGWSQMQALLKQHSPVADVATLPVLKKISYLPLMAACVLCILFGSFPLFISDVQLPVLKSNPAANQPATAFAGNEHHLITALTIKAKQKTNTAAGGYYLASSPTDQLPAKLKSSFVQQRIKTIDAQIAVEAVANNHQLSVLVNSIQPSVVNLITNNIIAKKANTATANPRQNNITASAKQLQFFAGAGINISAWGLHPGGLNIHPGVTVVIPLNKKFSLHTGLWAISTVHGKEAISKDQETASSLSNNLYYTVNTTSIIKASYFDVPLTLHYALTDKWSAGAGIQLSKLYKLSIKEQKENYDYNNTALSASSQQMVLTAPRAAAALQQKATIKNYEARLTGEISFHENRWLFTTGYYYGLGKNIVLKDNAGNGSAYRNQYFKLGVQYRLSKR